MKQRTSEKNASADSLISETSGAKSGRWPRRLQKVLVANRGEIARRWFLALREAGIESVAVVTDPDRDQSWSDGADEVVLIGAGENYTNIASILAAARSSGANAIYPGYGFLSENPDFPAAIEEGEPDLIFMGPPASVMRRVGHKLDARALAREHQVPIFEGSDSFGPEQSMQECLTGVRAAAEAIGYPVILKLNAGGGGKGMEIVSEAAELPAAVESVRRVGHSNYGDATFYLERYIVEPVHIEVQIFNSAAIGIRKCAVQRRNQKVVEESGESLLSSEQVATLFAAAERMAAASGYAENRAGAGTVEFLYDASRGGFGFLEMNTRLQVEYAVTDLSRNADLVAWQIENFDRPDFEIRELPGVALSQSGNPLDLASSPPAAHAIQCRLYAEDAFRDYAPAPGRIAGMQLPAFDGVRCDFGFQAGDEIVGRYDPMIGKLLVWGPDREVALSRLERALGELYIEGLTTNLDQLLRIVRHPAFRSGDYDNRLLDAHPELHKADVGPDAALNVEAAIFGCAAFARREATELYRELHAGGDDSAPNLRELIQDPRLLSAPSRFRVAIHGKQLGVELVQVAGGSYYVFVDDRYAGVLHIQNQRGRRESGPDAESRVRRVRFGGRSYRLRAEYRAGITQVRCTEAGGRVTYFRMRISSVNGGGPEPDPSGMVRAPFRGSFVALASREASAAESASGGDAAGVLRPGDRVRAGQTVITLSAMKMETRVFAPCDGVLSFLIEEGRLDRLVLGRTPDGLVQGRSIAEGDVLFVVSPDRLVSASTAVDADTEDDAGDADHAGNHGGDSLEGIEAAEPIEARAVGRNEPGLSRNLLDHLRRDTLVRVFDPASRNHARILLGVVRAALLGRVRDRSIIENVTRVLEGFEDEVFRNDNLLRKETENILRSFLYLRRAFAQSGASSLLQLSEMPGLAQPDNHPAEANFDNGAETSAGYSISAIFDHFGRECGFETPLAVVDRRPLVFEMLRMYRASGQNAELLLPLISGWSRGTPEALARPLINRLLQCLSKEPRHMRNQRLEERLRQTLQEFQGRLPRFRETDPVYSRNHLGAYRSFVEEPLLLLTDYRSTTVARQLALRAALAPVLRSVSGLDSDFSSPARQALPDWIPAGAVATAIQAKLANLAERYDVALVPFDPGGSGAVFRLRGLADAGDCGFVCFAWPHEGRIIAETDDDQRIVGAPNVESCVARAAAMLTACQRELEELVADDDLHIWYRLEIIACGNLSPIDLSGRDPRVWNRRNLKELASKLMLFFTRLELRLLSFDVDALQPNSGARRRLHLSFYMRGGHLRVALLVPEDPRHPYHRPGSTDPRSARLFAKGKWPAEIWAREAFDPGSAEEIRIPSIDGEDSEDGAPPVGARLYRGALSGRPAWFFLKDSRRNGGATGDREGRKFVAAAYLAYLHDAPLYVWNDGAGANIKEGMVALNRAAQGFMMNALLAGGVDYRKFFEYTRNQADPTLAELFAELDQIFGIDVESDLARKPGRPANVFLAAIGVGSSTGLDVYGSSQASIQILLDSEQSYRVLTGSSVIRSVTGEDLTNYEIGGARVMGAETGTADLIAVDRLDLLGCLRHAHELFSRDSFASPPLIIGVAEDSRPASAGDAFHEDFLQSISDSGDWLPIKAEYSGGESLLGGFLRLGGASALVLGPRTAYGATTAAAATRARELIRMAARTASHAVLVSGRIWHRSVRGEGPVGYRRYQEFVRDLGPDRRRSLLCLICTDARAVLERVELAAQADVIIFVDSEDPAADVDLTENARQLATFCVPNLRSAFNVARSLIRALENLNIHESEISATSPSVSFSSLSPGPAPELPRDASAPFDVVTNIIERVVDSESSLEFFADRDVAGCVRSLYTGLARLEGRTIAVIADQPVDGGAPDAPGTEKFRIFMEFVARFRLPLVMLSNAPGFVPGTKQERLRIQQIGGESLDVNILAENPVVSVVLNQNFGGRQIHAFSKFLRPGVAYAAFDRSILAVMGARAAFDLFHGRKYADLLAAGESEAAHQFRTAELAAFEKKSRADHDARDTGLIDIRIEDEGELRSTLVAGLALAASRLNRNR
ncbi:MAG: hypothetical protein NXI24_20340 [bacterium]|nr:hypothetical protein [bacterium]